MPASADDLLALNEELLALIRAGLPLDHGLRTLAQDVPGRLQPLANELAKRLEQGEELHSAIALMPTAGARVYAAVLAAGMRSGQPAAALQGIVTTARRTADFRRILSAELVYPIVVLLVGIALTWFSVSKIAGVQAKMSEQFGVSGPLVTGLQKAYQQKSLRNTVLLVVLVSGVAVLLWLPRRFGVNPFRREYLRPMRTMRLWQSAAVLCELLALLIENNVPLPEALRLAGEATIWPPLTKSTRELADRLTRGETTLHSTWPLPAAITWLLQRPDHRQLPAALRRESKHYVRRLDRAHRWYSVYFPALTTMVVGIVCLTVLATINFAPLVNLYHHMSSGDIQ